MTDEKKSDDEIRKHLYNTVFEEPVDKSVRWVKPVGTVYKRGSSWKFSCQSVKYGTKCVQTPSKNRTMALQKQWAMKKPMIRFRFCIYEHGDTCLIRVHNGAKFWIDKNDLDIAVVNTWGYDALGYLIRVDKNGTKIAMHCAVLEKYHTKPSSKSVCDHINGIEHDNRRRNLRWTTQAHNCRNRRYKMKTDSGRRGIFFSKSTTIINVTYGQQTKRFKYKANNWESALEAWEAALDYRIEWETKSLHSNHTDYHTRPPLNREYWELVQKQITDRKKILAQRAQEKRDAKKAGTWTPKRPVKRKEPPM